MRLAWHICVNFQNQMHVLETKEIHTLSGHSYVSRNSHLETSGRALQRGYSTSWVVTLTLHFRLDLQQPSPPPPSPTRGVVNCGRTGTNDFEWTGTSEKSPNGRLPGGTTSRSARNLCGTPGGDDFMRVSGIHRRPMSTA